MLLILVEMIKVQFQEILRLEGGSEMILIIPNTSST